MNELTKKPLSDLITINEQYARSTRIDQDDIAASGFIYSSSIDSWKKYEKFLKDKFEKLKS